jgi:hypothetical protein
MKTDGQVKGMNVEHRKVNCDNCGRSIDPDGPPWYVLYALNGIAYDFDYTQCVGETVDRARAESKRLAYSVGLGRVLPGIVRTGVRAVGAPPSLVAAITTVNQAC